MLKNLLEAVSARQFVYTKRKEKRLSHVEGPVAIDVWKGAQLVKRNKKIKNSVVTSHLHVSYVDQKVLESRKADHVTVSANTVLYLLLVCTPFRQQVYQKCLSRFYLL